MPTCLPGQTYNRTLKACREKRPRGRKPGSRKSDCPVGQTYNRTLKACRAMKKRGRPARNAVRPNTPVSLMPPTPGKRNGPMRNVNALGLLPASTNSV